MNTYEYILQKYKITPHREYSIEIPNMGRSDLATLFAELSFNKGVEIGVERGEFSEILCLANPKLHLTSIDPYKSEAYEPGISGVNEEQTYFDGIYEIAKKRLAQYNCTILRKNSMDALSSFADESLDFVYIDGNHDFLNVTQDIHYWTKKIRVGGILSGHDYARFPSPKFNHVKRVVENYMASYNMLPYFLVGTYEYIPGQTRDRYRSWFWVKK